MNQRRKTDQWIWLADRYLLWVGCDCTNCSSICAEGYRGNNGRIRLWSRVPEMNRLQSIDCAARTITHSLPTPSYTHTHTHTHTHAHRCIYTQQLTIIEPEVSEQYIPLNSDLTNWPLCSTTVLLNPFFLPTFLLVLSFLFIFSILPNSFLFHFLFSSVTPIPFLLWFIPRHTSQKLPLLRPLSTTGSLAGPVYPKPTPLL